MNIKIIDFGEVEKAKKIPKPNGLDIHIGYKIGTNVIRMYQKVSSDKHKGTILENVFAEHKITTVSKKEYNLPGIYFDQLSEILSILRKKKVSFEITNMEASDS